MNTSAATPPNARAAENKTSWNAWGVIARVIVALIFLAAAQGKIAEPLKFAEQIQAYRMISIEITNAMAFILPWLEVIVAVLLICGVWRREARGISLAMLLIFTAAKLWAEIKGLHISCGCFGGSLAWLEKSLEGWPGIAMNVVLIALLVTDAVAQRKTSARPAGA